MNKFMTRTAVPRISWAFKSTVSQHMLANRRPLVATHEPTDNVYAKTYQAIYHLVIDGFD